jgi:L-lysine 2,3-aminomutase
MDRDDPNCPIRKQVVPSVKEKENRYGIPNYLIWKENRDTDEVRPDSIARQYYDRIAFSYGRVRQLLPPLLPQRAGCGPRFKAPNGC